MKESRHSNKNPLSVISLDSYDFTKRGLLNENLDILAALKTAQGRFLKHILKHHSEEIKRLDDIGHCGTRVFLRHFPATGERYFAGGFTCKSRYCLLCSFRRAYVAAKALYAFVQYQLVLDPYLVAVVGRGGLRNFRRSSDEDLAHCLTLMNRSHGRFLSNNILRYHVVGSICIPYFGVSEDYGDWQLDYFELLLVNKKSSLCSASPMSAADLWQVIWNLFCSSIINGDGVLTHDQQFEALQVTASRPFYAAKGLFSKFSPPENDSSDEVPASRLADQQQAEQYRWDHGSKSYVLERIDNGGGKELFPLADHRKAKPHKGKSCRARRAAKLHLRSQQLYASRCSSAASPCERSLPPPSLESALDGVRGAAGSRRRLQRPLRGVSAGRMG